MAPLPVPTFESSRRGVVALPAELRLCATGTVEGWRHDRALYARQGGSAKACWRYCGRAKLRAAMDEICENSSNVPNPCPAVVWGATTSFGCAAAKCPRMDFVV